MHSSSTGIEVNPVAAIPPIAVPPHASSSQEAEPHLAVELKESKEEKGTGREPVLESKHAAPSLATTHVTHSFQDQAWHDLLAQLRQSAPAKQQHIFISYAWEKGEANHKLQKKLKQIEQDLEAMGFDVFLDVSDMDKDITKTMEEGVKTADVVLPILTNRFGSRVGEVMDEQGRVLRDNNLQFEFAHTYSKIINSKNDHAVIPLRFAPKASQNTSECYVLAEEPTPEQLKTFTEREAIAFYRNAAGDWFLIGPSKHGGFLKENLLILIKDANKRQTVIAQLAELLNHVQVEQVNQTHQKNPQWVSQAGQVSAPLAVEQGALAFYRNAEGSWYLVSPSNHGGILKENLQDAVKRQTVVDQLAELLNHLQAEQARAALIAEDSASQVPFADQLNLQQGMLTRAEDISTACAIASVCGAATPQDLSELSSIFRVPAVDFSQADNTQFFRKSLLRLVALLRPNETLNLQAWHIACLHNAPLTNPYVTGRTEELAQLAVAIQANEAQVSPSQPTSLSSVSYYSISGPEGIGKTTLVQYYAQQAGLSFVHRIPAEVSYSADAARDYLATVLDVSLGRLDETLSRLPRGVFLFENPQSLDGLATDCWSHHLTFVTHTTEAASTLHLGALTSGAAFTYLFHQLPQASPADREILAEALHYDPGLLTQASYLITHSVGLNVATYLEVYSDIRIDYRHGQVDLVVASNPSVEHKLERGPGDLSARAWDNLLIDINAIDPQIQPCVQLLFTATDEREHGVFLQQLQLDLSRAGVSCTRNRDTLSANILVPILTPAFLKEAGDPNSAIAQRLTEAGLYKQTGVDEEKYTTTLSPISLARIGEVVKGPLAPFGNQLIRLCATQADYQKLLVGLSNPKGLLLSIYDYTNNHPVLKQALDHWHLSTLTQLPSLPAKFCGRAQQLAQLTSYFTQHYQLTISSLGGMGKSQLAMVFAHRSKSYAFIRWLSADSERLDGSFRTFAEDLGLSTQGLSSAEITQAVHDKLETLPQGLLILDNVPDAKVIEDYLPKSLRHHILITSRSHTWDHCLRLDTFSEADAQAYLQTQLPAESGETCSKLTQALSALPLALDQAAAYIQTHHCTIKEYLARYTTQNSNENKDANDSVYTTWRLSIEAIQQACPQAVELLYYCAYLQPDAMPFDLLEKLLDVPLLTLHHDLISLLSQYSLIGSHEPGYIRIHRLVQTGFRAYDRNQVKRLLDIKTVLFNSFPLEISNHADVVRQRQLMPHLHVLIEQLKTLPDSALESDQRGKAFSDLCHSLGNALREQGNLQEAITLFEAALASDLKTYHETHPCVIKSRGHLASALQAQGQLSEAIVLFKAALESSLQIYGEDHPNVAIKRNNLAGALKDQGNLEDAIVLLKASLTSNLKTYGKDHSRVAESCNNLALVLKEQGNLEEAIALYKTALENYLKIYSEDHPHVAIGRGNLAIALQAQGNLEEAIVLFKAALASDLKTYGEDHPDVAMDRNDLARALSEIGELDIANRLTDQAYAVSFKIYGEKHRNTAQALMQQGRIAYLMGDYDKAHQKLLSARTLIESLFPRGDLKIAEVLIYLGSLLSELGQLDEALFLHEHSLAIKEKRYSKPHGLLVSGLREKAITLHKLEKHQEAAAILLEAIGTAREFFGESHYEVGLLQGELGLVYKSMNQLMPSKEMLSQATFLLSSYSYLQSKTQHYSNVLSEVDHALPAEDKSSARASQRLLPNDGGEIKLDREINPAEEIAQLEASNSGLEVKQGDGLRLSELGGGEECQKDKHDALQFNAASISSSINEESPPEIILQSAPVTAVLRSGVFGHSRISPATGTSHSVSSATGSTSRNSNNAHQTVPRRRSVSAVLASGVFGPSVVPADSAAPSSTADADNSSKQQVRKHQPHVI